MEGQQADMLTSSCGDLTGLLQAWSDGDRGALEQLALIVDDELRRLARRYLSGERSQ